MTAPGHGMELPSGRTLYRAMREIHRRQMAEVKRSIAANRWNIGTLERWTKPMAEVMEPLLRTYYQQGGEGCMRRLRQQLRAPRGIRGHVRAMGRGVGVLLKDTTVAFEFDVFNPLVLEAIRSAAFEFCQATNDTATREVNQALADLRTSLASGLEEGESLKDLTRRVKEIFDDPARAQRIAMTEASRGMHAGQVMAAKQSGVVIGKRWLASSDACELCLPLDGVEVGLDDDFAVDPTGGTYARVPHPPRHPHCMCSITEVIGRQ